MRQMSGSTLQQVQMFKYLGVVFTSNGRRSEETDKRIGKAKAVLREFHRSVVTKQELSYTGKLSIFKSVFVPIITCYGYESWVVTEKILTQVQAPKMWFLWRVHGATKGRTEVRLCAEKEPGLAPPCFKWKYFGVNALHSRKKLRRFVDI